MKVIIQIVFLIWAILFTGCAQKEIKKVEVPQVDENEKRAKFEREFRGHVVQKAMSFLNKKDGGDCSGFVKLVNNLTDEPYYQAKKMNGHMNNGRLSYGMYNYMKSENRTYLSDTPNIGDLVFFANTLQSDKSYANKENITHVGIIVDTLEDGSIVFIHHSSGKVVLGTLNLNKKDVFLAEGKAINTYMKQCNSLSDKKICLSSNLFSSYGAMKIKNN